METLAWEDRWTENLRWRTGQQADRLPRSQNSYPALCPMPGSKVENKSPHFADGETEPWGGKAVCLKCQLGKSGPLLCKLGLGQGNCHLA